MRSESILGAFYHDSLHTQKYATDDNADVCGNVGIKFNTTRENDILNFSYSENLCILEF